MKTNKNISTIIGVLFITVMITWYIGDTLISAALETPDFLKQVYKNKMRVTLGVLFEIIEVVAVAGIAVLLFPIIKKYNEKIAIGYLVLRVFECVMLIVGAFCPLLLITLSYEYSQATEPATSLLQTTGTLLMAARTNWSLLMLAIFYSLAAIMFYYVLYRTKLIPRFISVWGLIGAVMAITTPWLGTVFGIPMGLNELFLGAWLIIKGFKIPEINPRNILDKAQDLQNR